jgi:hypothetical protein
MVYNFRIQKINQVLFYLPFFNLTYKATYMICHQNLTEHDP